MPRRCSLTISEKLEIIEFAQYNKLSLRALANIFNVGKSHVGEILKHKTEILQAAKSGAKLKSRMSIRKLHQQYSATEEGERSGGGGGVVFFSSW